MNKTKKVKIEEKFSCTLTGVHLDHIELRKYFIYAPAKRIAIASLDN